MWRAYRGSGQGLPPDPEAAAPLGLGPGPGDRWGYRASSGGEDAEGRAPQPALSQLLLGEREWLVGGA